MASKREAAGICSAVRTILPCTDEVESWCSETNTFHFSTDEATVTLKEVSCIYGLPINGPAVADTTFPNANAADVF
ncbi:hypothetical protein AAC387_Pa11g0844 [Persea americana]